MHQREAWLNLRTGRCCVLRLLKPFGPFGKHDEVPQPPRVVSASMDMLIHEFHSGGLIDAEVV